MKTEVELGDILDIKIFIPSQRIFKITMEKKGFLLTAEILGVVL